MLCYVMLYPSHPTIEFEDSDYGKPPLPYVSK